MGLDSMLSKLINKLKQLKTKVIWKGRKLQDYYEKISGIESEFDEKTAELVATVHSHRDEQVNIVL